MNRPATIEVISFRSRAGVISTMSIPSTRPLFTHAVDQRPHVMVEQPARRGGVHRRHHRGVDAVGVDAQVVGAAVRDAVENRLDALLQHVERRDDLGSVGECVVVLLLPRASLPANADL